MAKLFKSIGEVQQYVRIGNALDFRSLEPAIREVESIVLEYYLGKDLLAEIVAQYEAQTITLRIEPIYEEVRMALANLAVYNSTEELEVLISENGIVRQESSNEKTAYAGQISRLKERIGNRGWAAIDKMLKTLEAYEQDYPEWMTSEYYTEKASIFFTSAADFHQYESIKRSPLTFKALFAYVRDIQELSLSKVLPASLYNQLKTEHASGSLSAENKLLLHLFIKPALAKLCMYQALQELPVEVDHEGVTINQLEMAGTENRTRRTVPNQFIERKMWALDGKGKAYLADMAEYLNTQATAEIYPLWFSSKHYDEPISKKIAACTLTDEQRNVYRA